MKKNNINTFGIISLVSLLASMLFSYLWCAGSGVENRALAVIALMFGLLFSFAVAKCLSSLEVRENEKLRLGESQA